MDDPQLDQLVKTLEKKEHKNRMLRSSVFICVGLFFLGLTYKIFIPKKEEVGFNLVEILASEAVKLHEDAAQKAFLLPTSNAQDIENYFKSYLELGFNPIFLKNMPAQGWDILGASIIDYKIKKIAFVQYKNEKKQSIATQFMCQGTLDELPNSKEGHKNNLTYRAYSSEQVNMIIWAINDKVLSIFASHLSVDELAELASHL